MTLLQQIFSRFFAVWICVSLSALFSSENTPQKSPEFFVVIPSYNNCQWCERNLESVFAQTYQNWTLFYIDDCSTDGTGELVDKYVKARGMEQKCFVTHNSERRGAMANLYFAIHQAAPDKIIVDIDGDDWLSDTQVFQTLADAYKDPSCWMTYGSYQYEPGGERGICQPIPESFLVTGVYRADGRWITSHLKTFYAGLFHKIKKEDCMRDGKFLEITSDVAIIIPMFEMALPNHIRYIDRIMYIYNFLNPLSDTRRRLLQIETDFYIRSLEPYKPIGELFPKQPISEQAEIVSLQPS